MEYILDDFAHTNGLREVDTRLKLILGIGCILIGVLSPTPYTPVVIGIVLGYATVSLAGIPYRIYLKLLAIPASFAVMSCVIILLLTGGGEMIWSASLLGYPLLITTESVNLALLLLGRTFGGMSALYFIALTTPMVEIFSVMRSCRLPSEFIDLSMLIYRFIFVLIGEGIAIHNAQEMRHGYTTFRNALHSFSMLGAMLFIRSWDKGEDLVLAMDSRCYDGKLGIIEDAGSLSAPAVIAVIIFLAGCIVLMITTRTAMPV